MKQKQSGSVHLIITIILVLALLGALGFIFWQNVMNKKDTTAATAQTTTAASNATPTATTTPTNDNLAISQWGITVPAKDFVLLATSSDGNSIDVTTQAIIDAAKKINCADTGIGHIFRATTTTDSPSYVPLSSNIGGNYYGFWSRSQAACTDGQGNAPDPLNSLMMDAESAMKAAIVETKAS